MQWKISIYIMHKNICRCFTKFTLAFKDLKQNFILGLRRAEAPRKIRASALKNYAMRKSYFVFCKIVVQRTVFFVQHVVRFCIFLDRMIYFLARLCKGF